MVKCCDIFIENMNLRGLGADDARRPFVFSQLNCSGKNDKITEDSIGFGGSKYGKGYDQRKSCPGVD